MFYSLLFGAAVLTTYGLILLLRKIKGFQSIYALSPQSHQKKALTVSMGGIAIILCSLISSLWISPLTIKLGWALGLFASFSLIGFLDDFLSMMNQNNKGLTAKQKFITQCIVGGFFLLFFHVWIGPLAVWEWIFYEFLIVGVSNATNLTDGLDGLLGGLSIITLAGFVLLFTQTGQPQLSQFCMSLVVVLGAFLVFNWNPAKVFMGDTGSLALGALFAGLAIVSEQPLILLPLGIVYIIETLSVMIQVTVFKRTKQRVFLMSPLHHHFELLGLSEKQVVFLFWVLGLIGLGLFGWSYV
jgi:phospho-N-acetylmuramoyl-pentapeptide-transferase